MVKKAHNDLKRLLQELVKTEETNFKAVSQKFQQLSQLDAATFLKDQKWTDSFKGLLALLGSHLERNQAILHAMKKIIPEVISSKGELNVCILHISHLILSI